MFVFLLSQIDLALLFLGFPRNVACVETQPSNALK